jgi:hypothetical protein
MGWYPEFFFWAFCCHCLSHWIPWLPPKRIIIISETSGPKEPSSTENSCIVVPCLYIYTYTQYFMSWKKVAVLTNQSRWFQVIFRLSFLRGREVLVLCSVVHHQKKKLCRHTLTHTHRKLASCHIMLLALLFQIQEFRSSKLSLETSNHKIYIYLYSSRQSLRENAEIVIDYIVCLIPHLVQFIIYRVILPFGDTYPVQLESIVNWLKNQLKLGSVAFVW